MDLINVDPQNWCFDFWLTSRQVCDAQWHSHWCLCSSIAMHPMHCLVTFNHPEQLEYCNAEFHANQQCLKAFGFETILLWMFFHKNNGKMKKCSLHPIQPNLFVLYLLDPFGENFDKTTPNLADSCGHLQLFPAGGAGGTPAPCFGAWPAASATRCAMLRPSRGARHGWGPWSQRRWQQRGLEPFWCPMARCHRVQLGMGQKHGSKCGGLEVLSMKYEDWKRNMIGLIITNPFFLLLKLPQIKDRIGLALPFFWLVTIGFLIVVIENE